MLSVRVLIIVSLAAMTGVTVFAQGTGGTSPGPAQRAVPKEAAMKLTSPDFSQGAPIPKTFTADGADLSPTLAWGDAPAGTKAFALVVDDPDAPVGLWVHWVLYDLPAAATGLARDQARTAILGSGARQGRNSWSRLGWNGPSPPPGKAHRYFFKLYALDGPTGLEPGATAQKLEGAIKGKVLGEASLMGTYGR
jgi:Raf kinase inhibitor-like YbhB/YbcL family protein